MVAPVWISTGSGTTFRVLSTRGWLAALSQQSCSNLPRLSLIYTQIDRWINRQIDSDNTQGVEDQGLVSSAVTIVVLKLTKAQLDLHIDRQMDKQIDRDNIKGVEDQELISFTVTIVVVKLTKAQLDLQIDRQIGKQIN